MEEIFTNNLKPIIIETISDINKNQWNNIVETSPLGSFFQRYEWLKSIERGIELKPKHIIITKNNNPIGIFPNFIMEIKKTPFKQLYSIDPGFGGPIITSDEKNTLNLMLENIKHICKKTIILHNITTLNLGFIRYEKQFRNNGYNTNLGYCRFIIDLTNNYEKIKENMKSSKRRKLNKCKPKDFEIINEKITTQNIKKFHNTYSKVIKRVGGHIIPINFFINLKDNTKERIKIFNAVIDNKSIGRFICILDTEQSTLHHYSSSIDEKNFRYYPYELLHEYAIKWGIENNFKKYDFGGTISDVKDNIFKFKEEFGGLVTPTISWEKGYSKIGWYSFKLGRKYIYNRS